MAACRCFGAYHRASVGRRPPDCGGWSGVASVCCRVVRFCGAERTRFRADAPARTDPTLADAGSARHRNPIRPGSSRKRPGLYGAACTVGYDGASDHNGFRQASADAAETQCHATGSGSGARTRTCGTVALPDWRSQCGRGNACRAANGEPDGHSRREPQLTPSDRACRDPRSGARPCGRPAFRLGQGQSILPARL